MPSPTPLLWVLREQLGLTGTKYGCGVAQCGACTVHIDGVPTRSCVRPVSTVKATEKIVTIEGLSPRARIRCRKAWVALDVPQCGFCQSGMIMAAAALLETKPNPTDADIDEAMTNICRCGTYNRIRAAIKSAAKGGEDEERRSVDSASGTGARHDDQPLSAPLSRNVGRGGRHARRRIPLSRLRATLRRRARRLRRPALQRRKSTPGSSCKPDDTVVIRIARSEMGQGSLTGLAQLVAEELDCNWSKVTTEYPTPGQNLARNRVWGNFSTGGSRGIPRFAGIRAQGWRDRTDDAGAGGRDSWKVPVAECVAANSVITHTPSGRSTTYGKVAAAAAKVTPPTDVPLKNPKDWKLAGKRLARLDTADKVTGAQIYGMDLKLPECSMPRSRTARCSVARSRAWMPLR
jgi:aerobic-type carbon monoxide dehydrogenase small subunit (CoxS/CutS family)